MSRRVHRHRDRVNVVFAFVGLALAGACTNEETPHGWSLGRKALRIESSSDVYDLAIGPDESWFVISTTGRNADLRSFDSDAEPVSILTGVFGPVAVSSDARILIGSGADWTITHGPGLEHSKLVEPKGVSRSILLDALRIVPRPSDAGWLAVGSGVVHGLVAIDPAGQCTVFPSSGGRIRAFACGISVEHGFIIIADRDGKLRIIDAKSLATVWSGEISVGIVGASLCVVDDLLFVGTNDGIGGAIVFDLTSMRVTERIVFGQGEEVVVASSGCTGEVAFGTWVLDEGGGSAWLLEVREVRGDRCRVVGQTRMPSTAPLLKLGVLGSRGTVIAGGGNGQAYAWRYGSRVR